MGVWAVASGFVPRRYDSGLVKMGGWVSRVLCSGAGGMGWDRWTWMVWQDEIWQVEVQGVMGCREGTGSSGPCEGVGCLTDVFAPSTRATYNVLIDYRCVSIKH